MIWRITGYAGISGCVFASVYFFQIRYSYADLKGYADALLNASSMIFTLMGIWIAFLYPNALSRLTNPAKIATADFSETLDETRRLEAIVLAVLKSGLVVIGVLAIALLKLLLSNLPFFVANIETIKAICLTAVSALSLLQVEAIFGVIYANFMFLHDLHNKREDRQLDQDL